MARAFLLGLAGLLLGSCIIYIAGDAVIDRLARSDRDAVVRTAIWAEHWRAFLGSPLLGYGIGSTETVNKTLISTTNFSTLWNIKAILNVYLQWLEQAGLFGAVPMFACVGSIILTTLAGALRRSRMTLVLFGLLSLDVVFLVHGATDFALDAFSMAAMWSYFLGLQLALSQGYEHRLVLVLHELLDLRGQVFGLEQVRIAGLQRLQDAPAVREEVGHHVRLQDPGVLGLDVEHLALVADVRVVTEQR